MNLIFSNCLLFNKGQRSRRIRKMAVSLRSLFEDLCASQEELVYEDSEDQEEEMWRQCNRCLKWRHIVTTDTDPCCWKCGDNGDGVTCDTPEVSSPLFPHPQEPRPLGKLSNDGNSFQTVIDAFAIRNSKPTPSDSIDIGISFSLPRPSDEIERDNFSRYLQTCWACSSRLRDSLDSIAAAVNLLPLSLLQLHRVVISTKKVPISPSSQRQQWRAICKALHVDDASGRKLREIYEKYVEPFEAGWKLLFTTSKREMPSMTDLYCEKRKKGKKSGADEISCCLCGCRGEEGTKVCDRCFEVLRPSWEEIFGCIACGLPIKENEVEMQCWRCSQCRGLFHKCCVKTQVDDMTKWVCDECKELPDGFSETVPCTVVDPTSRLLFCYYP